MQLQETCLRRDNTPLPNTAAVERELFFSCKERGLHRVVVSIFYEKLQAAGK